MNIGQAAKITGISSKMIRHYEAIGLLPAPYRNEVGYRLYSKEDVNVLHFIKTARTLGFSLDEIKKLLSLWRDKNRSSADVKSLVTEHIQTLNQKIQEMSSMRDALEKLASECQGDHRSDCPILLSLSPPHELSRSNPTNAAHCCKKT